MKCGLEIHQQLSTDSKLFSGSKSDIYAPPNTVISEIIVPLDLPKSLKKKLKKKEKKKKKN